MQEQQMRQRRWGKPTGTALQHSGARTRAHFFLIEAVMPVAFSSCWWDVYMMRPRVRNLEYCSAFESYDDT